MTSIVGTIQDDTEYMKNVGMVSLLGGFSSFIFTTAVLYFLRLKEATHFCDSSILFTFIINHCLGSIIYILQGSLILANFEFASIDDYVYQRIALKALDEYTFLCGIMLAILMFFDSFRTFSNPFKRRENVYVLIASVFTLAAVIIAFSTYFFTCPLLVESAHRNWLMVSVLPFLIIACFIFHCKLTRQSSYFKRLTKENFLLAQTISVQQSYLIAFIIIFAWELFYLTVLVGNTCRVVNTAIKATTPALMMVPFLCNVHKIYVNFPEELHQVSLAEWTRGQLRHGVITFMMKSFQEVLGEKSCVPKRKDDLITIPMDSFVESSLNASVLLLDSTENGNNNTVDTSDNEYYIGINSESVISDYLNDILGKESIVQESQKDSITVVEASPKIYQEIRSMHGVTDKDILEAFCVKKYKEGKMLVSVQHTKNYEKFAILPQDSPLVLKTMSNSDYKHLQENIAAYFHHIKSHPENLLCQVLGVFSLIFPKNLCIDPLHFFISHMKIRPNVPGQLRFTVTTNENEVGQKLDFLSASTDEIQSALANPAKLTDVSNLQLSKTQILRITKAITDDIEFLRSIKSSAYDLYFIAEMRRGTIILGDEIKDALMFDHTIKGKLFVYYRNDGTIIIQELSSTYVLEYHICSDKDIKIMTQLRVLEARPRLMSRDVKRLVKESVTTAYGGIGERKNVIICFDSVKEIIWRPQADLLEGDMPNPEKFLIPDECAECQNRQNHIRICRFSRELDEEDFGIKGNPLHQILFSWNGMVADLWKIKLRYKVINFTEKSDYCPEYYGQKFFESLNRILVTDK